MKFFFRVAFEVILIMFAISDMVSHDFLESVNNIEFLRLFDHEKIVSCVDFLLIFEFEKISLCFSIFGRSC